MSVRRKQRDLHRQKEGKQVGNGAMRMPREFLQLVLRLLYTHLLILVRPSEYHEVVYTFSDSYVHLLILMAFVHHPCVQVVVGEPYAAVSF